MRIALAIIIIPLVLSTIKSIGCIPISSAFQNLCRINFGYEFNDRNWFGVVKLEPQIYNRLRTNKIKLNLTLSTSRFFPEFQNLQLLRLYKSLQDTYKDIAFQHPIIYRIDSIFDDDSPVLSRIHVNDIEICNLNMHAMTKIELEHTFYLPTIYTQQAEPHTGKDSNSEMDKVQNKWHGSSMQCGIFDVKLKPIPMVSIRGSSGIAAGTWPWLVGIFRKVNRANLVQRCTGSLINNRMVLTAAHCFKFDSKFGKISSKNILLAFGRFDIRDWTENDAVNSNVKKIILHPDHMRTQEAEFFDNDVAIVITESFINFNAKIRPICLWPPTTDKTAMNLIGRNGTVVSWGHPTDNSNENPPRRINLPIVHSEKCFPNDKIQKERSVLCAGTEEEGHTTCKGDSGSGFAIWMNETWFLRGIVSGAISDSTMDRCGLETYIIFTDVVHFQDWIAKLIREWSTADSVL